MRLDLFLVILERIQKIAEERILLLTVEGASCQVFIKDALVSCAGQPAVNVVSSLWASVRVDSPVLGSVI